MRRHPDRSGDSRSPGRAVGALVSLIIALVAAPLAAQGIKIPDFRNEPPPETQCADCGVVRSIREISSQRPRNVPDGMTMPSTSSQDLGSANNVVGGVFVHSFGPGGGQTYVGGVGTPEMQQRLSETSYELTVRMDDGGYRMIQRRDGARFQVGDRVRILVGSIEKI